MVRSIGPHTYTKGMLLLAWCTLVQTVPAQTRFDRDLDFVRALATDMRFFDLARSEAEALAREFRGVSEQEQIAQLAVVIAYEGARFRQDRAQQHTLFQETIRKTKELVEGASNPNLQLAARTTLANALQDFSQFLTEELDLANETAPSRSHELLAESHQVFRAGIAACEDVMIALADLRKDEPQNTEYYLMWMKKAVLTREQGRADPDNRGALVARASDELTKMVLDAGEETVIGLRGLFELAQCKEVDGDLQAALTSYKNSIQQIAASLKSAQQGEVELTPQLQAFLFAMLQEVYARAAERMVREGAAGTAELLADFRRHLADFGKAGAGLFDLVTADHGHQVLLAECRFHAESGDDTLVTQALSTAQRIHDKHPTDAIGMRAKSVLRDMLNRRPSLASGSLLLELAKGELRHKNYEAAGKGLRRAIAAMTADEQQRLGLQACLLLGNAYAATERYLEAILAVESGLARLGRTDKVRAAEAADFLDRAITAHRRLVNNDQGFESFYAGPLSQVKAHATGGGAKLLAKQGNDLFNQKKYAEAIAQYRQIQPDFPLFEQVQVHIARAQSATGDFAACRATLTAYRDYARRVELSAGDVSKQQVRATALADAEFTEVALAYFEARGSAELQITRDLTKYPAAFEKAQAFLANFARDGDRNVPATLEYVGRLHCDLGKLDRAEEAYTQLKQKNPVKGSQLATEIFREYQNQVRLLGNELDQAIAKGKEDAEIASATADVAAMRLKLVALGMDYIANSPRPQLPVMVATLLNWEQLHAWQRVEEVAQKVLDLYAADATEATQQVVTRLALPKLGEALLQQRRFTEAHAMLLAAEAANPTHYELKRQICRALGGWFAFSQTGAAVKEPGLDRPAQAYAKYYTEYQALRPKLEPFGLEWYRFQWEAYWFATQAGSKDSQMQDMADSIYRIARSTDEFESCKRLGAEGLLLFKYFQANR